MEKSKKLFEVLLLERDGETFYMFCRAAIAGDAVEFRLEIDKQIYQQLQGYVLPAATGRCRLSLQNNWDPFLQHHFGKITRFQGEKSDDIYFCFFADFCETLAQLKNITAIKQLLLIDKLTFVDRSSLKTEENRQSFGKLILLHTIPLVFHVLVWPVVSGLLFLSVAYAGNQGLQTEVLNSTVMEDTSDYTEFYSELLMEEVATGKEVVSSGVVPGEVITISNELKSPIEASLPAGYVALTFDDGPGKFTKEIVDILTQHQVHATFFFIGKSALHYPDEVKYAAMHNMSVQNHSWSHRNMTKLPLREQMAEISKTNDLLTSLTNEPVTLFRPPYGAKTERLAEELAKEEMKTIMWNRDPKDWQAKNAQDILQYIYKTNPSEGLYLFHENRRTVEALPKIIAFLKEANVEFVILK